MSKVLLAVLFIFVILGLFFSRVYADYKSGQYPRWFTVPFMIAIAVLAAIGAGWLFEHYFLLR